MKNARLIAIGMVLVPVMAMSVPAFAKTIAPKKSEPIASFGKKRDNHTPIEVTADTLEVEQEDSKAIFSGHVVAIQGDLRLTAEKMTVYYAKRDAEKGKKAQSKRSTRCVAAQESRVYRALNPND